MHPIFLIQCIPKAPVPQSLRPRCDLSATDFDYDLCKHSNFFSITGIVAYQSPISCRSYRDH